MLSRPEIPVGILYIKSKSFTCVSFYCFGDFFSGSKEQLCAAQGIFWKMLPLILFVFILSRRLLYKEFILANVRRLDP